MDANRSNHADPNHHTVIFDVNNAKNSNDNDKSPHPSSNAVSRRQSFSTNVSDHSITLSELHDDEPFVDKVIRATFKCTATVMTTQQALRDYYSEIEHGRHVVRECEMDILENAEKKESFEQTMGRSYRNLVASSRNKTNDQSWAHAQQLAGALLSSLNEPTKKGVKAPECYSIGITVGGQAFMSNTTTLYTKIPVRKFISAKIDTLETDTKLLRPGTIITCDLVGVDRTKAFVAINKLECIVQAEQLRKILGIVNDMMAVVNADANDNKNKDKNKDDKSSKPPTPSKSNKKKKKQDVYDDQGDVENSPEFIEKRKQIEARKPYLGKPDGAVLSTKGQEWKVTPQLRNPYTNQQYALKKRTGQCLNCLAPNCAVYGLVGEPCEPKLCKKFGGIDKEEQEGESHKTTKNDEDDNETGTLCPYCATGIDTTPFSGAEIHIDFIDTLVIGNHGEMIQAQLRNTAVKYIVDEDDHKQDNHPHDNKDPKSEKSKKKMSKKEKKKAAAKAALIREGDFGVLKRMQKTSIARQNRQKEMLYDLDDAETRRIAQFISEQLDIDYDKIYEEEKNLSEEEQQKRSEKRMEELHEKLQKADKAKNKLRKKREEQLEKHRSDRQESEEGLSSSVSSQEESTNHKKAPPQEGAAVVAASSAKKSFVSMRTNINAFIFNTQFAVWEPVVDHFQAEARGLLEANTWHLNIPNKSEFIISPHAMAILTTVPMTLMPPTEEEEKMTSKERKKAAAKASSASKEGDEKSVINLNEVHHEKEIKNSMVVRVINKHIEPVTLLVGGKPIEIPGVSDKQNEKAGEATEKNSPDQDAKNHQESGMYELITSDTYLSRGDEKIQLLFDQHFFFLLKDVVCELCVNDEDPDPKAEEKPARRTIIFFPFHPSGAMIRVRNNVPCPLQLDGIGTAAANGGEVFLPPSAPLSNPFILQPLGLVKGNFRATETTRKKPIPSFQHLLNGESVELFSQHTTEKRLLLSFRVSAKSEGSVCGAPRMTILIEGGSSFTNNLPVPVYIDVKYQDGDDDVDDRYKLMPQETRQLIHTNNVQKMKVCFRGVQEGHRTQVASTGQNDEAESGESILFSSGDQILKKGKNVVHLFAKPEKRGHTTENREEEHKEQQNIPPREGKSSKPPSEKEDEATHPLVMSWQYVVNDEYNHFDIQAPFSIVNHSPLSLLLVEEGSDAQSANSKQKKALKEAWKSYSEYDEAKEPWQNYLHLCPDMTAPIVATPAQAPDLLVKVMTHDKKFASKNLVPLHAAGTVGHIELVPADAKDSDTEPTPTIQLTYYSVLTASGCMSVKIVPRWAIINKTPWPLRIAQKTITDAGEAPEIIVDDNSALPMYQLSKELNPDKEARHAAKKAGGNASAPFMVTISRAEEKDKDRGSPIPVSIEELTDALVALPESEGMESDGKREKDDNDKKDDSPKHYLTQLRVSVFPDGPRQFLIIEPADTSAFLLVNRTKHTIKLMAPNPRTTGPPLKKEAVVESKDSVITPMQALIRETTHSRNHPPKPSSKPSDTSSTKKSSIPDQHIITTKPFERRAFAIGQSSSSQTIPSVEMLILANDSPNEAKGAKRPDSNQADDHKSPSEERIEGAFLVPVSNSDGTPSAGKHLLRLGKLAYLRVTQGSMGQIVLEVLPKEDKNKKNEKDATMQPETQLHQDKPKDKNEKKKNPIPEDAEQQKEIKKEKKKIRDNFPVADPPIIFTTLSDIPMTTTKPSCNGLSIYLPPGIPTLDVAINLSYMAVSVVQQPREIISGVIVDLRARFERSEKLQTVQLSLLNFQFDNQTEERPPYQGMLFPIRKKNADPAVQALVQQRLLPGKNNMVFKEIRFEMSPLAIRASDLIIFRLMEFQQSMMAHINAGGGKGEHGTISAGEVNDSNENAKLQKQTTAVMEISNDPSIEANEDEKALKNPKFDKKDYDESYAFLTDDDLYTKAPVSAGIMQSNVTIEKMIINPVIVRLWFERQRSNAQRDIIRSNVQIAFLSHLVMSIEDVRVKVPGLAVTAQTGRLQSHVNKFQNFYIKGIMKQLAAIMLSFASQIPLVGAPIKLVSGVGASTIGFFDQGVDMSSPDAFAKGLASSTAALAGNVVGGSIVALGGIFSSGAKLTAMAAGERNDESKPMNTLTGFAHGFKGLFTKPSKGAAEEGATGLVTGLGQGLVGVVAAPASGILGDIGRGTRFVGSAMAGDGSVLGEVPRLRPIRPFYPGGAVAPLGSFIEVFEFQRKYHSNRLYWSSKMLTGEGKAWKPESKEDVKRRNPNIMSDAWVLDRCPGTTFEGWSFDTSIKGNFDRTYEPKTTHLRRRRWVVITHTKEPSGVTPPMQNVIKYAYDDEQSDEELFVDTNNEREPSEPHENDSETMSKTGDKKSAPAKAASEKNHGEALADTVEERNRLLSQSAEAASEKRKAAANRVFVGAHRANVNLNEVPTTIVAEVFENQRYFPLAGWGKTLLPTDREHWSTREGVRMRSKDEITPELGYEWTEDWHIVDLNVIGSDEAAAYGSQENAEKEKQNEEIEAKKNDDNLSGVRKLSNNNDEDVSSHAKDKKASKKSSPAETDTDNIGWHYAVDFKGSFHSDNGPLDCVRRRCWRRIMKLSKAKADRLPQLQDNLTIVSELQKASVNGTPSTTPRISPRRPQNTNASQPPMKNVRSEIELHDSNQNTRRDLGGITPSPKQHAHMQTPSQKRSPDSPLHQRRTNDTTLPQAEHDPRAVAAHDDDIYLSPSQE